MEASENRVSYLSMISNYHSLEKSLILNTPLEYKGLTLHPVGLKHIVEFYQVSSVLTFKQERVKDKKLMKMPYLWFLAYAFEHYDKYQNPEFSMFIPYLYALIELVCKTDNIEIKVMRKENGDFKKCYLYINEIKFNNKDFLELRDIILEQSGIEFDKTFVNEDAERAVMEGRKFEQKRSGYIPPTLEDLIDILAMYLHKSADEILETFNIRKFNRMIRRISTFEEWKLMKGGEYGGMVSFSKSIPHWMNGFEVQDMFADQNTNYRESNLYKV